MATPIETKLKDSAAAAGLALVLSIPFIGLHTISTDQGLVVESRWSWVAWAVGLVFIGRLLLGFARDALAARAASRPKKQAKPVAAGEPTLAARLTRAFMAVALLFAVTLPFMPYSDRYIIDLGTTVLIYILLALGLNVTVGLAGLLDLGFVAFYAIGAYSFALLSKFFGLDFWVCLPLSGLIAALFGALLSLPILRLRGDYLAIVTLGFGEITRIVILNWQSLTGGPNGVSGIPRPGLFGLSFDRRPPEGMGSFHELTGIDFSGEHRLMFLYLIVLALVCLVAWVINRLRALPVGRAWEALREDEIACRSLGINPTASKVSAYAIGGMMGGFAGCFFAARQGFVSPESFGFIESALILAIVVLGGMGSQVGVVIAALFIVMLPELGREFADYRMIVFGLAMITIMVWRPGGLLSTRVPTVKLDQKGA
ncbi:high-affinity branched-chain amino acid ABC transporter permease LivM [Niveispirillum sp. SYP-B3756]|uniref:high-affinity branched-chain amino acid ABC transporter permease LivM n=1 Tax=Niveispirillum sp. SYP-B3756 TaxID=2662178 RepID=UPI0012913BE2|nr:high-affinity branched-chain amino acid ABC transporter permease LivM [Niveispirillum sp. SYP-B3756]MQP65921.1 high-affinity branched-chain amino acid ABC transporter permease LivM [Niveispirillum sp. SYP-B3756]